MISRQNSVEDLQDDIVIVMIALMLTAYLGKKCPGEAVEPTTMSLYMGWFHPSPTEVFLA